MRTAEAHYSAVGMHIIIYTMFLSYKNLRCGLNDLILQKAYTTQFLVQDFDTISCAIFETRNLLF